MPAELKPKDYPDKFAIRMPEGMRAQLGKLAESNRRSLNSEILVALDNYLKAKLDR